eukprot:6477273-Ditylum_brightwellii.AAC.1
MQYYITTAFGITTIANYHGLFGPVYGIDQGATDRPPGWICNADIVLKCYERLSKGCTISDPTNTITQKDNSAMFIDNVSHHHNDQDKAITPGQLMIH